MAVPAETFEPSFNVHKLHQMRERADEKRAMLVNYSNKLRDVKDAHSRLREKVEAAGGDHPQRRELRPFPRNSFPIEVECPCLIDHRVRLCHPLSKRPPYRCMPPKSKT